MWSLIFRLAFLLLAISSAVSTLVARHYGHQDDARFYGIMTLLYLLLGRK